MDDAIQEFLVESHENLDQLDRDFVALEADPKARDRIAAIFRTIHTIKGTAGFLGFTRLESLAHGGESLLSMLREGELELTAEITSALLSMVDRVRVMLRAIEASGGKEGEHVFDDVLAQLAVLRGERPPAVKEPPRAAPVSEPRVAPAAEPEAPPPTPVRAEKPSEEATAANAPSVTDTNVRVDVALLDKLMNLVGELVLARNQILQFGARSEDATFVRTSQRLNLITAELQEHVMKTRMQPIGNVWSKLPRVVRDLAIACGKQVRVEMSGAGIELDRTVLEAIKDPLTHVVRNAVDHGIEGPTARAAAGKPKTGTLTLRAFHEGGQVNIEIADDGQGLDLAAIRDKAIQKNLISADRVARLSDHDVMQLVFVPGFSTAEKVTNVSGRGVGMDVVKTNIEKIGGTVDLVSRRGAGTTIKIKIPLTLAIVPALIVKSGGERYAVPQVSLLELVHVETPGAIERVHGAPVYRLRGKLLPLVFLNEQLGAKPRAERGVNILVLEADDGPFGLVVDEVGDTEEIVVKPLGRELKGIDVFAGATIMGDGRVALILDVLGLAQHSHVVSRAQPHPAKSAREEAAAGPARAAEKQTLLLFSMGEDRILALPLSMVARLEEFPRAQLERAGSSRVVQYRGEILPLIDLAEIVGGASPKGGQLPVIVYSEDGRSVGFVVERILDVVDDAVRVEGGGCDDGLLGAAIIGGKVTDVLDVHGVIRRGAPAFFSARRAS